MIHVGDNTWNLRVVITDLQVEKTLRVKGDLHIGGVMLKLSKTEGKFFLIEMLLEFPTSFVISANRLFCSSRSSLDRSEEKVLIFKNNSQSHACVLVV